MTSSKSPAAREARATFVLTKFMGQVTPCRSIFCLMLLSMEDILLHLLDADTVDHVSKAFSLASVLLVVPQRLLDKPVQFLFVRNQSLQERRQTRDLTHRPADE